MTGTHRDRSNDVQGFRFAWPFPKKASAWYNVKSYLTMTFVATLSKIMFIRGTNKIVAHDRDRFVKLFQDESVPLITVSNHRSNIDDPLMWSILSLREFLGNIDRNRYTLAAHNICFTKQFHTTMFSLGRCVPCVRGEGVYQKGMDFCVEMLNANKWVHIFPEGRVVDIQAEPLRFKWGIGRLIMDAETTPRILPIWCRKMEAVWPTTPPYYPRFGFPKTVVMVGVDLQTVDVHIGEPFDLADLKRELSQREDLSVDDRRKLITDEVQLRVYQLGERVGELPRGSSDRLAQRHRQLPSRTSSPTS